MDSIVTRFKATNPLTNQEECQQYDYNFLARVPQQVHLIECEKTTLPIPSPSYRGSLAFVFDPAKGRRRIYICLKKQGILQWIPCFESKIRLISPLIELYKEMLGTPYIWSIDNSLATPEIWRFADQLNTPGISIFVDKLQTPRIWWHGVLQDPIIEKYVDKLGVPKIVIIKDKLWTPQIEEFRKLDTPSIYYEIELPPQPTLHPAILGQAILGQCYLGQAE